MKTTFEISETIRIKNRGIVLLGTILDGVIQIGDHISFDFNQNNLKKEVIGIDAGIRREEGKPNTGLLIPYENDHEMQQLKGWDPNNQVAIIT